ncbi:hypothetical protein AZE42_03035 [Rhizopogon vesiculosus]|uniref:Uncharacterized protein n=1 Tax=Rhizopogon vesiculosus TaxID=180088 RepID=A0A1J8Q8D6_9AGAM|nr:hypothetical protein AZE42_03035 [Rhizopogon vesiculosus]
MELENDTVYDDYGMTEDDKERRVYDITNNVEGRLETLRASCNALASTTMSYDLGKAVGFKHNDQPVSWTRKDILTYALGVGAKHDELSLVYELGRAILTSLPSTISKFTRFTDKSWGPLPTYPVVLGLKGDDQDVTSFANKARGKALPAGFA